MTDTHRDLASPAWALRLLAVAIATLLVLLACESSEEDKDNDPANVVDALADQLLPCFPHAPCPGGWTCVGGVCLKSDAISTTTGGKSDTSGGGSHPPWTAGTPIGLQYKSSRSIPCQSPVALAWDGSDLWCADGNGGVARRFSASGSNQTATAKLPSGAIIDMGPSGVANRLNVAATDGKIWRLQYGYSAQQLSYIGSLQGLSYDPQSAQILTVDNNNLLSRRNTSSLATSSVTPFTDSGCARLAWSNHFIFRWCGTTDANTHRVRLYDANSSPKVLMKRELAANLNASGNGGLEVNGATLWLVGSGTGSGANRLFQYLIY